MDQALATELEEPAVVPSAFYERVHGGAPPVRAIPGPPGPPATALKPAPPGLPGPPGPPAATPLPTP